MQIVNTSSQKLFVHQCQHPSVTDPDGASAIAVRAGQTLDLPGRQDGLPSMVWLYSGAEGGAGRKLFWKGPVPAGGVIDADPGAGRVTWNPQTFDVAHLERARAFVGDGSLDGVTLEALRDHAATRDPQGPPPDAVLEAESTAADGAVVFSECELKVAGVVLDCVLLVLGMGSLIKELNTKPVLIAVADAVGQGGLAAQANGIEALAAVHPTGLQMAGKVFGVIEKLGTTFPSVVAAVISNLSALDKVLYGGLVVVQIAAIAATDGAWAVPFVAIQLGISGLLLGKDIISCYQTCNPGVPLPIVPPAASEGSYIVGQQRRFVPSSNPSNPSILLWLEPGTYSNAPKGDLWDIQPSTAGGTGQREVTIRSLEYPDQYAVAPTAVGGEVIVETLAAGGELGGRDLWMPKTFPAERPYAGYILQTASPTLGSAAMHAAVERVTLQPITPGVPPTDPGFYFQDLHASGYDLANEFRIGWRLDLFPKVDGWSFWNGEGEPGVPLPTQVGTLTRPDDINYWSLVALARSNNNDEGYAMVRSWSDAAGRHVQASFVALHKWVNFGKADPEISSASASGSGPRSGAILSAYFLEDDDDQS